ncbi:capping complex subunit for YIEGIA [Brevibacillus sp. SYSU BS000544]|uniref:capping complex subunit for YIEGIA n=1 Tax=Brevibacillus sp. SYSU BS000544 TaxID=3416443 RepID=UPI003CE55025
MSKSILAVITTKREQIGGGAPIFIMNTEEEVQKTAFTLEKILDAMVHKVTDDTLIIVRHR